MLERCLLISARASFLVLISDLHPPLMAEVTVFEPGFLMPLIVMQRCSASRTTQTDLASTAFSDLHLRSLM